MRTIKYTNQFKRDYRREKSGRHSKRIDAELLAILKLLETDSPLPHRHHDHALSGNWDDHRDCHIRPTSCSSTASRTAKRWNWCASAHIVSWDFKRPVLPNSGLPVVRWAGFHARKVR